MDGKNIGNAILEYRKKHNITQSELGEKLNVSDKTISRWERGDRIPDSYAIKEISKLLNISCDELLGIKVDENINEWIINVKISDTYDFAYDSDYNKKYTLLNNGAWAYQNTGLLTTYRWDVEYSVCYLDINK